MAHLLIDEVMPSFHKRIRHSGVSAAHRHGASAQQLILTS